MSEKLEKVLTPNREIISYTKLLNFLKHRIKVYEDESHNIQMDTTYYILNDPEVLKLVEMNERIIDEYEWLLEFVKENNILISSKV